MKQLRAPERLVVPEVLEGLRGLFRDKALQKVVDYFARLDAHMQTECWDTLTHYAKSEGQQPKRSEAVQ
ncbi:MAG TPA: hypothetical protein VFH47_02825 [Candidatus Thermoplasmatota archaeon]|nr:hypothetical protein [Candidatus Thermoplasmatota archaeon]